MKDFTEYFTGEYYTRSSIIKKMHITPATFSKWLKGSRICPPMPHNKITPPSWKGQRILIPKKDFDEWVSKHKPWLVDGVSDYKNWRKYRKAEE